MWDRPDTLMLFCAGKGTRMGVLTETCPKPLIRVAGKPLIAHALEQKGPLTRLFANTHTHADVMEKWLDSAGIETVFEPELLETGGGLKNALPRLGREVIATLNTDAVWVGPAAFETLAAAWDPDRMDALLLLVPMSQTRAHLGTGDFSLDGKQRATRGGDLVYTGAQIIKSKHVSAIDDKFFSLNRVWNDLIEAKRLFGVVYSGTWVDVGHPDGISIAEKLLDQ